MKRHGFTLIELLIVVAIIAILAAIAVPNFLEAQTRSRISRAQNDLRTIALGMESYRVDNNSYPLSEAKSWLGGTRSETDKRLLTTPISYCSTIPVDVFLVIAGKKAASYRVYGVAYTSGDTPDYATYPKTAWMTWSIGADLVTNCGGYLSLPLIVRNEGANPPGIGKDRDGNWLTSNQVYNGLRYDPTNGTISYGDIYRHEGEAIRRYN